MSKQWSGNASYTRRTSSGNVRIGYGRSARTAIKVSSGCRSKKY